MKAIGFTLLGAYYRSGRRYPGGTIIKFDDKTTQWFDEDTSIDAAIIELNKRGYDTAELKTKLDNWVKTGSFTL